MLRLLSLIACQQLTADHRHSAHTSEEIKNVSVENGNPSRRYKKILPNFDLLLPKFHFILPNFYLGPPWGNFVSSLEIPKFLGRN